MPSKKWSGSDLKQRAHDALDAIDAIRSYVHGMTHKTYLSDRKTQSAVERELLVIAEACGKMLEMDEAIDSRYPSVPWRSVRGMGNLLRHEYGRVDPDLVWHTVTGSDLTRLRTALKKLS